MSSVISSWKVALLALLGGVLLSACSGDPEEMKSHDGGMAKRNGIELIEATARATTPGMSTSAAYMIIRNTGREVLQLEALESPVANRTELHTTVMQDGAMKMQQVEDFQVKPGEEAVLKPGGYHVMLMGLKKAIAAGDKVPVTLTFTNGNNITVEAVAMKEIKGQGMAH
ncbi:MAG: copper chaperone PCu(A)C [Endozoicomonas sp.]